MALETERVPLDGIHGRKPAKGRRHPLRSIASRLIVLLSAVLLAANLLTFAVVSYIETLTARGNLHNAFEQISLHLVGSLSTPLWQIDDAAVKHICDSLMFDESIAMIRVYDDRDNRLCDVNKAAAGAEVLPRVFGVHRGEVNVGRVELALAPGLYDGQYRTTSLVVGLFILINVCLTIVIIKIMMKRVMQAPISELTQLTRYYSEDFTRSGKPSQPILTYSEFAGIEPVLRQMAAEITQRAQELLN